MNAALYHRVSTRDQNKEAVRPQLRAAAVARGLTVVLDIEETGSGARNDRPGLQQVMAAVRAGKVKQVVVWKLDRFGRSTIDLLTNLRTLNECGCRFWSASQGLEDGPDVDPAVKLNLKVVAAVAEYELEMIRDRTADGLDVVKRNLAEKGEHTSRHSGKTIKQLGRPRVAVDVARARALFNASDGSCSWSSVARALGVNRETLRRALKEADEGALKKGPEKPGSKTAENGGEPSDETTG
jgi:putative DNA-invertase from lambdoid prophage Rac